MSGTSLDGVDMALCDIDDSGYNVLKATTVPYPAEWRRRLAGLDKASAYEYALANVELGHYLGRLVKDFVNEECGMRNEELVDKPNNSSFNIHHSSLFVASHGHTIFHQPQLGLTTQIGDGDAISAECNLPVISNFRTLDVALGGQGAPLVPIGDRLLFGEYDACLNLGGIANISYEIRNEKLEIRNSDDATISNSKRVAFDICPCNMALNRLASLMGLDYDPDGANAARGNVHTCLKMRLDDLPYYSQLAPKSLGKEWFEEQFWPLINEELGIRNEELVRDLLATVSAHVAWQIARVLVQQHIGTLLVTGGGAFNRNLIERIEQYAPSTRVVVPDALTVNYKEAIVFALLGYLRLTGKVNTLASVTGARQDSCGGTLSGLVN